MRSWWRRSLPGKALQEAPMAISGAGAPSYLGRGGVIEAEFMQSGVDSILDAAQPSLRGGGLHKTMHRAVDAVLRAGAVRRQRD
jgi:hypothetical protein